MKKLLFLLILIICIACDNDDGNATNQSQCNFQGFSYLDSSNNDQSLVAQSELSTQYFPNASNGPFGMPGFEIASSTSTPTVFFTTNVLVVGQSGTGTLSLDGQTIQTVNVMCQRIGTNVGDEVRYDVTIGTVEIEICVLIDEIVL